MSLWPANVIVLYSRNEVQVYIKTFYSVIMCNSDPFWKGSWAVWGGGGGGGGRLPPCPPSR